MTEPATRDGLKPHIVFYVAMSLDGYIATPHGGIKWLAFFEKAGEDYGYATFYSSIDAVVLGSKTYERTLTFGGWPYPGKPCWVCSHRRLGATAPDVTVTV